MSHLTPELRVNKNGVPVVKHVNNQKNAAAGAGSLPVPQPTLGAPAITAEQAIKEFTSIGPEFSGKLHLQGNMEFLAEHRPRLLKRIVDEMRVATEPELKVWKYVLDEANDLANTDPIDEEYETYDDWARNSVYSITRMVENVSLAVKLFPDDEPHTQGVKTFRLASRAERTVGWKPGNNKYVENQAAMILFETSSYELDRIGGYGDDIWFIADNMERVLPLLPELRRRNQTSRDLIESLWENKSPALVDGVL